MKANSPSTTGLAAIKASSTSSTMPGRSSGLHAARTSLLGLAPERSGIPLAMRLKLPSTYNVARAGSVMVRAILALRYVMLAAALGAILGAVLMFWQGGADLADAARFLIVGERGRGVAAYIMHATDAILFGIVLIVFAYAIAFGFVIDLPVDARQGLPSWMRVESVSKLKQSLIEVILVYMVVDVATDWAQADGRLEWSSLIKPGSIILIAGALRLLSHTSDAAGLPSRAAPSKPTAGSTTVGP